MTQATSTSFNARRLMPMAALVLLPLAATAAAVFAAERPVWAVVAVAAASIGIFLVRRPDAATLVVIFLLYTNTADVAATFHGVPKMMAMGVFALLLVPLTYYLLVCRQHVIMAPAMPLVLLYLAVQAISALAAKWPDISLASVLTFLFEGVAVYFLITNVVRTKEMLRAATWTLLAAGTLIGAIPLWQQATGTFQNNYGGFGQITSRGFRVGQADQASQVRQARLCGPIGEQNRYAQIMLMLVPIGLCRMWSEKSRTLKALALGAACIAAGGAAVAFSRGAVVAFGLTLVIGAVLGYVPRKQALALGLAGAVGLLSMPQYWPRLASIASLSHILTSEEAGIEQADGAARGRLTMMAASALVFFDHPVLGVGPGMFKYHSSDYGDDLGIQSAALTRTMQAHVLFLDVAAETGLVGLSVCLAIVVLTLWRLARARRLCQGRDPEMFHTTTCFLLVLIVYLTTGLFLHFMFIRFFWLMMALAAAATWLAERSAVAAEAPLGKMENQPDAAYGPGDLSSARNPGPANG